MYLLAFLYESGHKLIQSAVVLYLPLKCNLCEVVGWFFLSFWDELLKNVREANVKFLKVFKEED